MLQPGPTAHLPPTLAHDEADQWLNLERLTKFSGILRSSISAVLGQIHGPWLLHLHPRERLSILEAMASIYGCLGYKRKEAYVLREVLGCVMDLMVCGREEDGITKVSGPQNAGLGIQNGSGTPTNSSISLNQGSVGVRMSESSSGNDSILRLLKHVCRILGIDLDAAKLVDASTPGTDGEDSGKTETNTFDDALALERPEFYGWPELQVGVIREAVAVAEALPGGLYHTGMIAIPLMWSRFPCRCSICFIVLEDPTNSALLRGPAPPVLDVNTGTDDSSETRRSEVCRVLVWATSR